MEEFSSCSFTGYRPSKFPFELRENSKEFKQMENKLIDAVFSLPEEGCYTFYTGMAMGFDIIAAEIVMLLKSSYKKAKIDLICVLPYIDQSALYNKYWLDKYNNILSNADDIILMSDKYYSGCYFKRNKFLVDNSDYIITWYDGKNGGTKNTLNYALKQKKRIINLNQNGVHEYINDNEYDIISS